MPGQHGNKFKGDEQGISGFVVSGSNAPVVL